MSLIVGIRLHYQLIQNERADTHTALHKTVGKFGVNSW